MGISKSIQDAIKTITEQAVRVAPFDKTRTGIVQNVDNNTNTYSVQVDGVVYSRVKATGGIIPSIGDTVSVIFPTNNTSQMVINNINASNWIKGASDLIYPVGSYYWTSDDRFDPNITFTGTWEKIDAGVTLVSAGTGYTVQSGTAKDGGEATVKLNDEQMAHGHGFTNPTVNNHHHDSLASAGFVNGTGLTMTSKRAYTAANTSGVSYVVSGSATAISTSANTADATATTSGGAVANLSGASSTRTAHNNMPPYKAAYCWHRIS